MADEMLDTLTLVDDEGEEHEFILLNMLEIDEQRYAVLVPAEVDEDDEEYLTDIIDDDEFEKVVATLEAMEDEDDDYIEE